MELIKGVSYKIEEKTLKDGSKAFVVLDSKGYFCGVYDSLESAEKALPAIRYNVANGVISQKSLTDMEERAAKDRSKRFRQLSNKK